MNILIVSPFYPPFSGVGGMRMNSLSKYLRDAGDRVIVIRNSPETMDKADLMAEVPQGIEITDVYARSDDKTNAKLYYNAISGILEKNRIDLIVYSVGPFYTLRAAPEIKTKYGVGYFIDFRDLWAYEKRGDRGFINNLKHFLLKKTKVFQEKRAVKAAAGIVVVTPGDHEIMRGHYKKEKDRIFTIYNGFDEVGGPAEEPVHEDRPVTLVSLGKLSYYLPGLVDTLFLAMHEMAESGVRVTLRHVGKAEDYVEKLRQKYRDALYSCTGYVSYAEGLKSVRQSDICIITYIHPTGLGTKVFDYIACNKPIIMITNQKTALSEFVRAFRNGYVCSTKEQIKSAVSHILDNGVTTLDEGAKLLPFSRRRQNENYRGLIKQAAGNRP